MQVTFVEKPQLKRISFENYTHWNLIHTWSDTAFKGTFVNPTESSLHWRSLKITLTVSLRKQTLNEKHEFYWNRNFRILLSTDYFNFKEEIGGRKKDDENSNSQPKGILKVILVFYTVVSDI